jgi:hypothetical protein
MHVRGYTASSAAGAGEDCEGVAWRAQLQGPSAAVAQCCGGTVLPALAAHPPAHPRDLRRVGEGVERVHRPHAHRTQATQPLPALCIGHSGSVRPCLRLRRTLESMERTHIDRTYSCTVGLYRSFGAKDFVSIGINFG